MIIFQFWMSGTESLNLGPRTQLLHGMPTMEILKFEDYANRMTPEITDLKVKSKHYDERVCTAYPLLTKLTERAATIPLS